MSTKIKTPDGWKDVAGGNLEPIPEGFIQNVDTGMQPVEDGKVMRISKTAFDALAQRDTNVMYYLDEEHDLIDAKPTCRDADGNLVKNQKIVELTKEQYDNLAVKDPDTYYMITEDTEAKAWHPRPDWANAVSISVADLVAGYTAPSDGMIVGILFTDGNTSTGVSVNVNGIEVARNKAKDSDRILNVQCPVGKDDVITTTGDESPTGSTIHFVPWKAQ